MFIYAPVSFTYFKNENKIMLQNSLKSLDMEKYFPWHDIHLFSVL